MTVLRVRASEATSQPAQGERKFRPELQGLRALAAALVVVYHVWLGRVSGGVDVFFLISGFLITGQLFRAQARGGIRFRPMWGRMIKRLFPAALTVLLATMAASVLLLPEHRWFQTIKEVVAAALYLENWQLAADSVDYFAQNSTASVVQHFWSLSIQGQFYLVWPLLVAVVALAAHRLGRGLRGSLLAALSTVLVISLAYSVWLTAVNQPLAYFTSLTRVWEFALGGLLALLISSIVLPRGLRILMGWVGVAALVACGLVLHVGRSFPGYAALWPTLAAALVLLAGATGSRVGADRFLSSRPLAYLGNVSYALYLWHWPVLLFYLAVRDQEEVGLRGGAGVIGLSLLLAVFTYHFIESPVRESRIGVTTRWGAYRFGVAALAPVLVAAGAWQLVSVQRASFAYDGTDHPGAQALATGGPILDLERSIVPPFAAVPDEFKNHDSENCRRKEDFNELQMCVVGPHENPTRRLVVIGDSHAQQLVAGLAPGAEANDWQITTMLKGGCPLTSTSTHAGCAAWNQWAVDEIIEMEPDAVVTVATRDVRVGLEEHTPDGYVQQWRRITEAGIPLVGVRDNPRFDFDPPECVQQHGPTASECERPRAELYAPEPPYARIPDLPEKVSFIDPSDYYCTDDRCPPVVGNVLVYIDDNHVTKTYMATLAPMLETRLTEALGWDEGAGSGAAPR
ncbi:acyltransferase family protein [Saccharomonospora iraqiensis]|uniref:acyltransferase family protein n=1 Tax=Saccharomonospora iraqiensis TaxID=52698 RepID=UPI000418C24F|nr:acyltransferase family protein [Saccharomonospora iraqiensis]